ncbi:hypothetical protein ASZ90_017001 [hydrocarbon metagenome]|uniref:Uncharacterized protein n=1 Tax=hydrocarbon metagenome TaxID=938273 RepID=A0A0W8EAL7_9ZZZZ
MAALIAGWPGDPASREMVIHSLSSLPLTGNIPVPGCDPGGNLPWIQGA